MNRFAEIFDDLMQEAHNNMEEYVRTKYIYQIANKDILGFEQSYSDELNNNLITVLLSFNLIVSEVTYGTHTNIILVQKEKSPFSNEEKTTLSKLAKYMFSKNSNYMPLRFLDTLKSKRVHYSSAKLFMDRLACHKDALQIIDNARHILLLNNANYLANCIKKNIPEQNAEYVTFTEVFDSLIENARANRRKYVLENYVYHKMAYPDYLGIEIPKDSNNERELRAVLQYLHLAISTVKVNGELMYVLQPRCNMFSEDLKEKIKIVTDYYKVKIYGSIREDDIDFEATDDLFKTIYNHSPVTFFGMYAEGLYLKIFSKNAQTNAKIQVLNQIIL